MDELFSAIYALKNRTDVTSLLAMEGFKIAYTDFDWMRFEQGEMLIEVSFDSNSLVQQALVVS